MPSLKVSPRSCFNPRCAEPCRSFFCPACWAMSVITVVVMVFVELVILFLVGVLLA